MSHSKESENFKLFQEYDSSPPPPQVEDTLLERIRRDLHPSPWRVFFKLSSLHAFVGTLTLFVCPQFGYSFTHHSPLMHWFMQAGDIVCQLACGAFFYRQVLPSPASLSVDLNCDFFGNTKGCCSSL